MLALVFACSAVLAAAPSAGSSEDVTEQYRAARSAAGRDADAHVRLALWCESRGMTAERLKHLAIAVMTDPAHPTARGLLGLVDYRGKWQRPDAVAAAVRDDAALASSLAEYNRRREALGPAAKAADHFRLAVWCAEAGLDAESVAHLTIVTRLDPNHEAAWKRLGCKKRDGRWVSDAQLAAEKVEADAQRAADRRHRADLLGIRDRLDDRDPARRSEARARLDALTDPRATPSVRAVFGFGKPAHQTIAVQLLGQIDSPAATRTLIELALKAGSAEVRRLATETLKRKDVRDHLMLLVNQIRKPLRYEVRPVDGPGTTGVLFVEGERHNVRRVYNAPALPFEFGLEAAAFDPGLAMQPFGRRANGLRRSEERMREALVSNLAAANLTLNPELAAAIPARSAEPDRLREQQEMKSAVIQTEQIRLARAEQALRNTQSALNAAEQVQRQLDNDIRDLEVQNAAIVETNDRATATLRELTLQDFGIDRQAWSAWATDQRGYSYQSPATVPRQTIDQIGSAITPFFSPLVSGLSHSCFAAGVEVVTMSGARPIETLRVGDRVLSQDPADGMMTYQPVVQVFRNPPTRVLRIDLDGEAIRATGIHRFWKVGVGWTMARELKPGDEIRTVGGKAKVGSVEADGTVPVFNLQVARGASFFVGEVGALVHDNSIVEATPEPFDAATLPLASATR